MTRDRVTDSVGVVLLALAAFVWWKGLPQPVDPHFAALYPAGTAEGPEGVAEVARRVLVALLGTCALAAFGVSLTRWRSRWRPAFVAPLVLLLAGLAVSQLVNALLIRSELSSGTATTLAGLTPPAAVAATLVASVGAALLLAGLPSRPLAVVAGLLTAGAVATVVQEVLMWRLFGTYDGRSPALRYLVVHTLAVVLVAAGTLALVAGLRRPAGSMAREAAVGATVLWGVVLVALRLLSPDLWRAGPPSGSLRPALDPVDPYGVGVVTLLAAPAAALLVARMRARPGWEAVTVRWRGASAALAFLLLAPALETLGLLLFVWSDLTVFTSWTILRLVLLVGAGAGFALAALRRDAGPPIAVTAAILAVASVAVGPGLSGLLQDSAAAPLPQPLVLTLLAPLVVALSIALRSLSARRDRPPAEPAQPAEPAVPT